jgi:hypothetical protein
VVTQGVIDNYTSSCSEHAHGPLVPGPNVIKSNNVNANKANLFCFIAFADKRTWTLYNNLTGTFPFMSLKGNVCFLEVYHYTSNAILALPISGFSDEKVFAAYTKQYGLLQSKGFDIKLNVMENQPSKIIKQYLTPKQCNLMLVEPNIHHANVAERAIQAFIDNFFSALATTESGFLLQLWDCLAPLVETSLSMQRPSHIDPTKLAYEVIHGPYHWNCFPLAPPECNAVIYEPPKARTLCGSCGIDAWCVGPLLDHYRCEHFFVPETCGYFISGLAKLFPQHCHIPFLMWNKHLQEVINELVTTLNKLPLAKQTHILTKVQQ